MKVKTKLVDVKIECTPPSHIWFRDAEDYARKLEAWTKEFHEFIRDHRSQDPVELSVVRVFKDICSACHKEYEEANDNGKICCAYCGEPKEPS